MNDIAHMQAFNDRLSLEECLEEMEKYGNPRISKMDGGWFCKVKVFVTGDGVEFEVKSNFKCKTVNDAANECYQRLLKAIKQIKEGKK